MLKDLFKEIGQRFVEDLKKAERLNRFKTEGQRALEQGDYGKAIVALTSAYELGGITTAYWLGVLHAQGLGTEEDPQQAIKYYSVAASQNDSRAIRELGVHFYDGYGVDRDLKNAHELFLHAAQLEDGKAQLWLAKMFTEGIGTPKSYALAFDWNKRAAEQKVTAAYYELGTAYAKGRGVEKDYIQAYMWFNLGACEEIDKAIQARDALEEKMSADEINEAQKLTTEWLSISPTPAANHGDENNGKPKN